MQRFRNILFSPLADRDNPAAVRRIAELASSNGAKLTLFGTVPEPSRLQRIRHRTDYLAKIQDAETKSMAAKLTRCSPKEGTADVEVKTVLGNPSLRIIEQVLMAQHDLVVVTTDEDDEDHATINRLLRKCPCPVWVIRPTRARVQRVLAAVNPDPSEAALNRTIVEVAASMRELNGGELHVAHAWELYGEATMRESAFLHTPREELESLLLEEESSHQAALDKMLADLGLENETLEVHLDKGPPSQIVPGLVAKHRINLLVMGTVARTGVSGLLIGNTAESVIDSVRCSVIAIKPPDFVSPIHPAGS